MRQLLVECSDPGLVVTLEEEFENVLRRVDFDRARALQSQLTELARDLGTEVDEAWRGFRLEVPNDGGTPPSFGCREPGDEELLKQLLTQAEQRGIGKFGLRDTMLLPQGGPAPETREQYVSDLADGIRFAYLDDLALLRRPRDLPEGLAAHRLRLVEEHVAPVLRSRARDSDVGHRWVRDTMQRVEKALQEVNTRAEAVVEYELTRVNPANIESEDHTRWAGLAVRLGKEVEKWYAAAEAQLEYLYQRVALIYILWTDLRGMG
ncbi:MAG: hypothetical protein HY318_11990, partial [Armatimonadetes bacterium]|nr:hypothetical protein [Armatimonadota bacterium]